MREVFYLVATIVLVATVILPSTVGTWLQAVDTARFSCDTQPCWDETITH
jgi:hypothetical protein